MNLTWGACIVIGISLLVVVAGCSQGDPADQGGDRLPPGSAQLAAATRVEPAAATGDPEMRPQAAATPATPVVPGSPTAVLPPAALMGIEWRLVAINGVPVPPEVVITLWLEPGRMNGRLDCNTYGLDASLKDHGEVVIRDRAMMTLIGCPTRPATTTDVAAPEYRYLDTLEHVSHYRTNAVELRLVTADGRELVFQRRPENPRR